MATVKISELPSLTTIDANTENTVFVGVDLVTTTTGKMTATTLARGLYSNNNLAVGNTALLLPDAIAQFTGNSAAYLQVNLQNLTPEGSGDYVITSDDGSDVDHYLDLGMNGSDFSDPDYSAFRDHDGYLYIQSTGTNKGNLVIGTTNSTGKINFIVGGTESTNIVGYIDSVGLKFPNINAQITANAVSANSVINTRISANVATLRGEITTNVATLRGEITTNATTGQAFTQSAYNKANNALANTSGIFAGNLDVRGNIVAYSIATSNITSFVSDATPATNALVEIVGSLGGVQQTPSNDGYMLHITNKPNLPSRIVSDAFGSSNNYTVIAGRSARGTATSPTATQNNDVLMRITGNGWGTTGFSPTGVARIDIVATENYTDTARGSKIVIYNTIDGSNTVSEIASFNANTVTVTGVISPQKGFIYTPREFAGAQTAITINFANNVVLRANCTADITFSFANYTAGKQVEVWLTNTSGLTRTVTHGCSAVNSTKNATTFTIPGTATAWMKYYCVNGDLANTFVAIINA